jgi:16S rRNA (cytidine1402-2'-O)-methyltransferase
LGQAGLVAAEDTRVTRRLLNHLGLHPNLTSFHQHNFQQKLDLLLRALEEGDVALVTDAGMPGVSDPGAELVARAASAGFPVESVPGPSAVTTALAVSGLPGDAFEFLGFLPRRRKDRQARLEECVAAKPTLVLFEAPHRVRATLADVQQVFGDRPLAVCRELTKMHEEVFRGTGAQALEHFANPRGEFVLVIAGAGEDSGPGQDTRPEDLDAEIRRFLLGLKNSGVRTKDAVAQAAAAYGLPKNRVYRLWLEASRD